MTPEAKTRALYTEAVAISLFLAACVVLVAIRSALQ